jgi:hypothetical protein
MRCEPVRVWTCTARRRPIIARNAESGRGQPVCRRRSRGAPSASSVRTASVADWTCESGCHTERRAGNVRACAWRETAQLGDDPPPRRGSTSSTRTFRTIAAASGTSDVAIRRAAPSHGESHVQDGPRRQRRLGGYVVDGVSTKSAIAVRADRAVEAAGLGFCRSSQSPLRGRGG